MSDEWRQAYPENVQELDVFKSADSEESFLKTFEEYKYLKENGVVIPSSEAGDEDWNKFYETISSKAPNIMRRPDEVDSESWESVYKSLGRPDSHDKYQIPEYDKIEDVDINEEMVTGFKEVAHKAGLNQKQFDLIVSSMYKNSAEKIADQQALIKQDRDGLKQEWGAAYEDRLKDINMLLLSTRAPEEVMQVLNSGSAATLKWLHSLQKAVPGEHSGASDDKGDRGVLTPEEAKQQIHEIRNNPDHAFNKVGTPGHEAAKRKMQELYKLAYPE